MEPNASASRVRHSLRVLRPLIWWLLLVLVMYAIRTHQRLSEQTHLSFSTMLQGKPVSYEATPTLENDASSTFASGSRIPIGRHQLTLRHPKAEPFTTNLFIWYGENELGKIVLTRATGSLIVKANPPAGLIEIRGPEFSLRLTNSAGITITVPTDQYTVNAYYRHWQEGQEIAVSASASGAASFSPRFGVVQLTCNQTGAVFQVLNAREQVLEAGEFPATLPEMPAGTYKLLATHHGHSFAETLTVHAGSNSSPVQISYGQAFLETVPPGATVYDVDNHELGVTPLQLSELKVGSWQFNFRLAGYDQATGSIDVTANGTNSIHANLVSHYYSLAMDSARRAYADQNYDRAREAAAEALKHKPDDLAAQNLERDATGHAHLARAENLARQGAYADAITEVKVALTFLPENENTKALLADYTSREQQRLDSEKQRQEAEQAARQRQQRLDALSNVFKANWGNIENAPMFANHELAGGGSTINLATAINNAMTNGQPAFTVMRTDWQADTFIIEFRQMMGLGYRECLIVGGQLQPNETQILFKVCEYDHLPRIKILGDLLRLTPEIRFTSQDPRLMQEKAEKTKERILEGIKLVKERMQTAISK